MTKPALKLSFSPDPIGALFDSPFQRFQSNYHIEGLGSTAFEPERLDLLAFISRAPGKGHFRDFIAAAKRSYRRIVIWEVVNTELVPILKRYHFEQVPMPDVMDKQLAQVWCWSACFAPRDSSDRSDRTDPTDPRARTDPLCPK